jgi:uncharacterized cofD-like protein
MVALASDDVDEIMRELFIYRYSSGTGLTGMTFGNLFMAALTDIYGSQKQAIDKTCEILRVSGVILPVTFDNSQLVARYGNGVQVLGEHYIDEPKENLAKEHIVELEIIPEASPNPEALEAIKNADLIVLGPGDLYTSVICNLVVRGVAKAIKASKAKKLYIVNLMTKLGQTYGFKASHHVREIEKYLGGKLDYILVNKEDSVPKRILARYKEENASPVNDDLKSKTEIIRKNLISKVVHEKHENDKLTRSLIRHDSDKLAQAIVELL